MVTFLLWCLLLITFWPLAIAAIILYPIVWIILLPFRLVGITVDGILELLRQLIKLPSTIIRKLNE